MRKLFYIKHRYLSIVRSATFGGEVFAFVVLFLLFGASAIASYDHIDLLVDKLAAFRGTTEHQHTAFLVLYLLADIATKLVFSRPAPMLKYYALILRQNKSLTLQYLFTSLFGLFPLLLLIVLMAMMTKAVIWFGVTSAICLAIWWLTTHFLALASQFSKSMIKPVPFALIFIMGWIELYQALWQLGSFILQLPVVLIGLICSLILCYQVVLRTISHPANLISSNKTNYLDSLPSLSFKNPVIQLEWALIWRNKRTKTNLILGVVSVLMLPFIIDNDASLKTQMVFFIGTAFFVIQHGTYSFGWEGSFFDFLTVNIPGEILIKTRYYFYLITCGFGCLLLFIPLIIRDLSVVDLLAMLLYNMGITVPLTLYRSTYHDSTINLNENAIMNYNGMMTGPILLSTMIVMTVPFVFYGLGMILWHEQPLVLLGVAGIVGLLFHKTIIRLISQRLKSKKYHLSQSFKS